MNRWSIVALCIVVPAVAALVTIAAISTLRMQRAERRALFLAGAAVLPLCLGCVWLGDRAWLSQPWSSVVQIVGNLAGFVAAYALVGLVAVAARRGWA